MSQSFEIDEIVNIHLTESVVRRVDGPIIALQTASTEVQIDTTAVDVRVTRVRPPGGEPRPGEVWQDALGQTWFARGDEKKVAFYGADARTQHPGFICREWQDVNREFGPIARIWTPPHTENSGAAVAPATGAQPSPITPRRTP